ncbi:MAG: hypothetical protein KHZ99_12900 [Clostridium sp.]|uniref:hypothetical protein n=1 Tax=Clostridium TaxID=1485 RepID=UPI00189B969C|nr:MULTISPECIES: hypothetical protein [Clostridium]MBS4957928.1 hypothetical protein [Clostridium sp.]MDI9217293.1 hypothetical protein [Clostridium tertium]MDU2155209.1 hypothetical protein [Clostridium sp.]
MVNINNKVYFGDENLEELLYEVIKNKLLQVTHDIKNGDSSIILDKKLNPSLEDKVEVDK